MSKLCILFITVNSKLSRRLFNNSFFIPFPSFLHSSALVFIRDGGRWSGPLPAPLINARWLAVYCIATLAECRSGFRRCKSERPVLGLPPQASLNVKQPLSRYIWAQSLDLHYSPGSFVCATCPPYSLCCSHAHHLSLTSGSTPRTPTAGAELLYPLSTCITHTLKYIVLSFGLCFTDGSVDASCLERSGASSSHPNWYSAVCLGSVRNWLVIYGSEWKSTCLKRLMMCACWLLNRLNDISCPFMQVSVTADMKC